MNEQELQRWQEAARDRNAEIMRADSERAERALEAQQARAREVEEIRQGEAIHRQKVHALRLSVLELLRCANDLRMSGTHLYEVAHLAALAATETRHMDHASNMGDQIYAFTTWLADWTNMSAGRS